MTPSIKTLPGTSKARDVSVDVIRGYAIVLVILTHVVAPYTVRFTRSSDVRWWIENLASSFSRPCIPLFVMLSGLLLLNPGKNERLVLFFKKRFAKVVIPFIAWAIVYFLWRHFYLLESFSFNQALREIVGGPVYFHFWFIYMLLGLYLATPILRSYVRYADKNNLYYFVALWFFFLAINPLLRKAFQDLELRIDLPVASGYVGYFVLGYVLAQIKLSSRAVRWALFSMLGLAGLTALGTFLLVSEAHGEVNTSLYDYLYPNVILMSVSAFLVLRSINYEKVFIKAPFLKKVIDVLSRASFGIYLLHPVIIHLLEKGTFGGKISAITFHPAIGIPLTLLLVIGSSTAIIVILQRIPLIRRVVP